MSCPEPPVVEAVALCKRYGKLTAVDGIDFAVRAGEAFGVLGPNGAGKTSTMRMVACMSPPSAGRLRVFGLEPAVHGRRIRSRLGVVPQADRLDSQLSCAENIYVYGRYFGLSRKVARYRTIELLRFVGLDDRGDDLVETLSGGLKRRLSLARSLINQPDMLLLDEPTTGLDPHARQSLWDHLLGLKERGVSQMLSTHHMAEAELLCDRLVVMSRGSIIAEGSPAELITRYASREVVELRLATSDNGRVRDLLAGPGTRLHITGQRCVLYTDDGEATLQKVLQAGVLPNTAAVRRGNLEDVYLRLTGGSLVEPP